MGEVSVDDKMKIQILCAQGLGYRTIAAKYLEKNWKLVTLGLFAKRVDETASALARKPGGGRPRSIRTPEMIKEVGKLICLQENQPGTSKSTRKVAEQLNIHRWSFLRIVKRAFNLRRVSAQNISESVKQKRHDRCKKLICVLPVKLAKKVFLLIKKLCFLNPPVNHQNDRVWSAGKKRDIDKSRLVVERAKFAKQFMVSLVCAVAEKAVYIPDKAKVNSKLYCEILLPRLVEDVSRYCHLALYSSKTEHLLTRQSCLKPGLPPLQ